MYDIAELKYRKPIHAEGHPCVMLTDPLTGKIKEKIEGENHVFLDALLCRSSNVGGDWVDAISTLWMCLNDSALAVDANIPYLMGQTIGYGVPTISGTGTFRGAYNATNQVLAQKTRESVYWKFQYDFTTAQANGTINSIGLTHQYKRCLGFKPISGFPTYVDTTYGRCCTSDGRYTYSCTDAGIITKHDILLGTNSTIDVSAIVATASGNYKTVGYAPDTGKYYIYVYSGTASLRKMYIFSNSAFTSVEATYSPTNVGITMVGHAMYVYGNTAFWFAFNESNKIYYADFVNNSAVTPLTISTYNNAAYSENSSYGTINGFFGIGACPLDDKYIITGLFTPASDSSKGIIFDLSTRSVVGTICSAASSSYQYSAACKYPIATASLPYVNSGGSSVGTTCAVAAKTFESPVVKTSANGMTVTYELEVFW